MSSYAKDILEEIAPLLTKWDTDKKMIDMIEFFHAHSPKIDIDTKYQSDLRIEILEKFSKKSSIQWVFSWYQILPVFGTALACILFGVSISRLLFQTESIPVIPENMMLTLSSESGSTLDSSEKGSTASIVVKEKVAEYQSEKRSVDTEIQSIADDIATIIAIPESEKISRVDTVSPRATTSYELSQWADPTWSTPSNTLMMKALPPLSIYMIPEYATIMKVYAKPDVWTSTEIDMRSGSGLVVSEVLTEQREYLEKKSRRAIGESRVSWAMITYRVMSKIVRDRVDHSYLVPVIAFTKEDGEEILISLIRGFR